MNIYLIGFMGSGKSTAGKKLASKLKRTFCDLDKLIEERTGLAIPEIFFSRGESYFRQQETLALESVASKSGLVVACGGGTPCNERNMEIMKKSGLTIYLEMTPASLVQRLKKSGTSRPLIAGSEGDDLTEKVNTLLSKRIPSYKKADIVINGVNVNIKVICEQIEAKMA